MLESSQKIILETIFKSDLKKNASWGGGTALSEIYLHHRRSDDIDIILFDLPDTWELTNLANQIKIQLNAKKVKSFNKMNRFQYVFELEKSKSQKLEFVYYPFPKIGMIKKQVAIKIESLKDIAISKTLAAYQRNEIKDAFDLYIILNRSDYSLKKLIKGVEQKFGEILDPALLLAKLTKNIQDFDSLKPLLIDSKLKKEDIKTFFQQEFDKFLDKRLRK